jgi:penicillin-binding protein 1A
MILLPNPTRSWPRWVTTPVIVFFLFLLACVCTSAAAVDSMLKEYAKNLPDVSQLYHFEPSLTTKIYSADGKLIGTLYAENRTWVKLDNMSPWMSKAILSIEDARFRQHNGVDFIGIGRSLFAQIVHHDRQGASTITMQLARNLFLSPKQTMDRKIKEMLLAIKIERTFTKDEILEMYLNQIFLGSGTYGVQAASNLYFHRRVKNLTAAQAAMLAGLPQSPSTYSPLYSPKAAKARTKTVLQSMLLHKALDQQGYDAALVELEAMKFNHHARLNFEVLEVPYFTTYVIRELSRKFDEGTLYRGGLSVYTTVDLKLQKRAQKILHDTIKESGASFNAHTGAIVTIENATGYIRAMVGGVGWSAKNQFNRAYQARRQPGSSFKPYVYTTALECGMNPNTIVQDSPITIGNWSPKNDDLRFMGSIPLITALAQSRNVVSVRVAQIVGVKRIIQYAHKMGITEKIPEFISIALGSIEVSPLEQASAYTCFPNAGLKVQISGIKTIKDSDGNLIMDNRVPRETEVMAESTASGMVDMMRRVVQAGTGGNADLGSKIEAAGKTGTTDSFRDAWFVGYTRDYTSAVWIGNDDFTKMYRCFGGDLPAQIWHKVMEFANRHVKESTIARNRKALQACLFCSDSNMRAGPNCPTVYRKLMARGEIFRLAYCTVHGAPKQTFAPSAREERRWSRKSPGKAVEKPTKGEGQETTAPVPSQVEVPSDAPSEVQMVPPGQAVPAPEAAPAAPPEPAPAPAEVPMQPPPAPAPVPQSTP